MRHALVFVSLCVLIFSSSATLAAKPKVLVIESYHSEYEWSQSYLRGIRSRFLNTVDLFTFQMNTKRIPKAQFGQMADKAFAYYQKIQPDLVMLADDNASALLGERLAQQPTRIVYFGISANPRQYGLYGHANIAGVLERPLIKRSINILSQLLPNVKRVLVLFDDSTTSHSVINDLLAGDTDFVAHGVQCNVELVPSFAEWKTFVRNAQKKDYDAILLGTYHTLLTKDGSVEHEDNALSWINGNSPVPIFGLWDFSIGKGKTAGGFILRGEDQGYIAAQLAQGLLKGNRLTNAPVTILPTLLLNRHELTRWGIQIPESLQKRIVWKD